MKRFRMSPQSGWLQGTGFQASPCEAGGNADKLLEDVFIAEDITGEPHGGEFHRALCLRHACLRLQLNAEIDLESRDEVVVGYADIESDCFYSNKPHPVPERPIVLLHLLEHTQNMGCILCGLAM